MSKMCGRHLHHNNDAGRRHCMVEDICMVATGRLPMQVGHSLRDCRDALQTMQAGGKAKFESELVKKKKEMLKWI